MAAPALNKNVAALLAATRRLHLRVRRLVAGLNSGLHASTRSGSGREFSQFRAYQPGDEPRQIDWKLFARSDRFFIREGHVERHLSIRIVLDASGSMTQENEAGVSKFQSAQILAGAIAALAQQQGDAVSIVAVQKETVRVLPASASASLLRLLHFLAQLSPAGSWPKNPSLFAGALRRTAAAQGGAESTTELTVVLTDGFEHGDEIHSALAPLLSRRNEILWLHLQTQAEVDFPYQGPVRFEESETGRTLEADAAALRPYYLAERARQLSLWQKRCTGARTEFFPIITDQPLETALPFYLRRSGR